MIIIVMGVSGCGKSTVAEALARRIGGEFHDADPLHPPRNIEKMSRGVPLTDEDRAGWLTILADLLTARKDRQPHTVLACSALKESYRDRLRVGPMVRFLYLKGSFERLEARMKARTGHFMKAGMLASQFQTLEEPSGPDCLTVDSAEPVDTLVGQAVEAWGLDRR